MKKKSTGATLLQCMHNTGLDIAKCVDLSPVCVKFEESMDWEKYKYDVAKSREEIVFPFFKNHIVGKSGIGIDLGCGDGDLTSHLVMWSNVSMVGVDRDYKSLEKARQNKNHRLHFVQGDITKNILPSLGINFDFAVSNCSLSHMPDQDIYKILVDLHACLKPDGIFYFLVPCLSWAKDMYLNIEYVQSGITAVPRYGGRQSFRLPEWYISSLEKCGFESIRHEEILIPDEKDLELRYREKIGKPLFAAFTAKRAEEMPEMESLKKTFDVAHENRKLEIGLFWQRSLFFWGFVAMALVGYGATYEKSIPLSIMCALFGLVCSIVWASGNRGSKYWQEYWENKVSFYQHYTKGNIFYDRTPKHPSLIENYAPRRISVSKLTMALSDYMAFMWFVLCLYTIGKTFFTIPKHIYEYGAVVLFLLTLVYCLIFLRFSKSED